jgi:nucleotide-binding universal stress UspA family protein
MEEIRRFRMYKKVLVPLDGSKLAECVLPHVEALAKGCQAGEIEFVQVYLPLQIPPGIEPVPLTKDDILAISAQAKKTAADYLQEVIERVDLGSAKGKGTVLSGTVADTLAEYISKNGIELVVMATHGSSGVSRWIWGSVADRLLRSSCAPLVLVRAPGCYPGI